MKQSTFRARRKALRRHDREEFEILETLVNTGEFSAGPFASRGKKVSIGVEREGNDDYGKPTMPAAVARARQLSNQFWRKETHEDSTKPPLVVDPLGTEAETNQVQPARPGPVVEASQFDTEIPEGR